MRIGIFIDGTFKPERDGASTRFARLPTELFRLGIHVVVFHCFRGWSSLELIAEEPYTTYFFSPDIYYSDLDLIRKLAAREEIQILQMNDLETVNKLGFPLAEILGCHLVYEAHYHTSTLATQLNSPKENIELVQQLEYSVAQYTDSVITFTQEDRKRWISISGAPSERVDVVPFGVDTVCAPMVQCPLSEKQAVFVGNLYFEPNKRALDIICKKLFPNVKAHIPDARFVVVGDAPKELRRKFENNDVVFTGEIPIIRPWISGSALGLAPVYEGSGVRVKLLEYLGSGIPALSTSISAEGLCFPALFIEDDLDMYAKQWIELIRPSMNLTKRLRAYIEETISKLRTDHSWSRIANDTFRVYESVLSQPPHWRPKPQKIKSQPMWLEEVIRKGRFSSSNSVCLPEYYYGKAARGIIEIYS